EVIDYTKEDVTRRTERYDVIYDVAATRSIRDLGRSLAPTGTLVLAGAPKGPLFFAVARLLLMPLIKRTVPFRVVMYIARNEQSDLEALRDMVEAGTLCPVIDRQYPLSEAAEAIRYLGSGQARAKIVINVS